MNKEVSMNWSKAQRECTALNRFAKLAEIKSRTENDFIKGKLLGPFYWYKLDYTESSLVKILIYWP